MIANIIAVGILILCAAGAVTYMIRRHRMAVKTGCLSCCGCSACHSGCHGSEQRKN